jgi:hypothetical protein
MTDANPTFSRSGTAGENDYRAAMAGLGKAS